MPKDPTKNVDRYKIRGGTLNEFEYTENQGALADQKPKSQAKLIPGTPPEERDRPRPQVTKKATKTGAKKRATKAAKATKSTKGKSTKSTKRVATRGASAKKLAARKAAKKK
jgi:hypothetical protein